MSNTATLKLGSRDTAWGRPYEERHDVEPVWHNRLAMKFWHGVVEPLVLASGRRQRQAQALVARVEQSSAKIAALSDSQLLAEARALRPALRHGFALGTVARLFALVREAGSRVLGLRHYETQLMAGWWLLNGTLVEMATGEGKTYAATLPAITAALAGLPVHVITVNDYLAERDATALAPLYKFFGLRVAAVVNGLAHDARRAAYACDVTYASNKELTFDYLRDRATLGDRASRLHLAIDSVRERTTRSASIVLRGLVFGIVDEADSVFIDEARTPLILSSTGAPNQQRASNEMALRIAAQLEVATHFVLETAQPRVRITEAGRNAIEELAARDVSEILFTSTRETEEFVERALAALHLYARDQQYVVVDGKVQIVDESTGRAMPDRAWERGLHQMIETKECVAPTGARETLARITYQRFFRRHLRLAGMSGTATEVAAEIAQTYGLPVARVPLHRASRRRSAGARCFLNRVSKWRAVVAAIERIAINDLRPVLVGTRTVKASEELSELLTASGISHVVLNAKQDREETLIIARAGEAGRVTVATNMAGRGTDIALADGMAARGGLHVILTEYHESRRIDRQLFGRSARQGEPGSGEAIVALDDELFVTYVPRLVRWLASRATGRDSISSFWLAILRYLAQTEAKKRNRQARIASVKQDRRFARLLAFAGRGE